MLKVGHILQERYSVISELGRGGMGAVYKAMDLRLNITVALKELTAQHDLDTTTLQDLRDQFKQEATVLARLSHPNLVGVTDFFEEGRNVYLVMQFIEGISLADIIKKEGALSEKQVLLWATQLLNALSYCHNHGVIHRDIKPQNIIINANDQAILVDFGLVKLWNPNDPKTRTAVRGIGTPQYAPPEQYESTSGHTEPRSDIYSLGATLYHALTGQSPPTATLRIASPEQFIRIRTLKHAITSRTANGIERAMALPRTQRWATATEMASALGIQIDDGSSAYQQGLLTENKKDQPDTRTRMITSSPTQVKSYTPWWLWVFGIGILVVGVAGIGLLVIGMVVYDIPAAIQDMFSTNNLVTRTTIPGNDLSDTTGTVVSPPVDETTTQTAEIPLATITSVPSSGDEAVPTATLTPTPSPTQTASPTDTPRPTPTSTPTFEPTETFTTQPTDEPGPSPMPEIGSTGTFIGFETFGNWKRGDQPYADFVQSSTQVRGGNYAGKLTYDFPEVSDDYVVFTRIIPLSGQPATFSAWVYGDGSEHYLNVWILDAGNQIWSVHLGPISNIGWHKLTGELAPNLSWPNGHISGPNNNQVDYPVSFHSIVLDRPDTGPRQGIIYIDDVTAE